MRLNYPSSPDARIEMPASISARSGRTGTGEVTQTEVARMSLLLPLCSASSSPWRLCCLRASHGNYCSPTYLAGVVGGLAALPVGTSSAYAHYANEPSVGMQRVMAPPSRTVGSAVVETVSTQPNANVIGAC